MPSKIVISGATGRMGQTLVRLLDQHRDLELIGGIDREAMTASAAQKIGFPVIETAETGAELLQRADVVLDFSAVAGLQNLLKVRARELEGRALVVGTTGLPAEVLGLLDDAARGSAVIIAANFSIGVNLLLALVDAAARVLTPDKFDVEIVEAHHRLKVDAPSGTALALGKAIAQARGIGLDSVSRDGRSGNTGERSRGEIAFHALRGGDIVGEHTVNFIGARERVEITHKAQDRSLFAEGALMAAEWIAGKPVGMYSMKEVLGLDFLKTGE
jgi:4-hydroxy-tetrahydrodipicolinate reductase